MMLQQWERSCDGGAPLRLDSVHIPWFCSGDYFLGVENFEDRGQGHFLERGWSHGLHTKSGHSLLRTGTLILPYDALEALSWTSKRKEVIADELER